jgi:hypothetical protein
MTPATRRVILRANDVYLGLGALGGLTFLDLPGVLGAGPGARILSNAPHAAIGFVEAHGLALILSVLLWRAAAVRPWHVTGAAIGLLLGTCNLVFWQIFVIGDALATGYVTTGLHWVFAVPQCRVAPSASHDIRAHAGFRPAVSRSAVRHF